MAKDDEKIVSKDEVFEGDEMLEEFMQDIDENGLSMATMDDGHAIGFTLDKLQHFVELAEQNTDKRLIIFIRNVPDNQDQDTTDFATASMKPNDWKN